MLSSIIEILKDNSCESTLLNFAVWLFHLEFWQIIVRHLRDDTGSLDIPDELLDEIAKCLLPNILAFVHSERGKAEFAKWKAERAKKQVEAARQVEENEDKSA